MFTSAARSMGYEVIVLDPDPDSPAGSMATRHLQTAYTDREALDYLALKCEVITTEFENIPAEALCYLADKRPVYPSANALAITQNRIREKTFIQSLGLATSPFIAVEDEKDLELSHRVSFPAILKTATLGYDGKGQIVCQRQEDVIDAYRQLNTACVLEQRIELDKEISVVLARNRNGQSFCFPAAKNEHVNGILDASTAPAGISDDLEARAQAAAQTLADGLDYCGVLAVEFFVSTAGELLVNEIAPRPHNSGHYTLDACYSSQFEQQVRMICDLPPGNTELHTPVVMLNLLGDVWPDQRVPPWQDILVQDKAKLHLYGKKQARIGRKMGHINFLADSTLMARQQLEQARIRLQQEVDKGFDKSD
jgi:5-(carboxyamino)imidazole ribonucleotide synthase